jgi:hypothetical protein
MAHCWCHFQFRIELLDAVISITEPLDIGEMTHNTPCTCFSFQLCQQLYLVGVLHNVPFLSHCDCYRVKPFWLLTKDEKRICLFLFTALCHTHTVFFSVIAGMCERNWKLWFFVMVIFCCCVYFLYNYCELMIWPKHFASFSFYFRVSQSFVRDFSFYF